MKKCLTNGSELEMDWNVNKANICVLCISVFCHCFHSLCLYRGPHYDCIALILCSGMSPLSRSPWVHQFPSSSV